jgi:tape measure domain-containing protein
VDKNLQISIKINADATGLNKAISSGVKKVRVPVDLDTGNLSGAGKQIGSSFQAIAAGTRIGLRTDQAYDIGDIISKTVVKGVEDSLKSVGRNLGRGNVLGALGNIAAAPFKIAGSVASNLVGGALSSTRIVATEAIRGLVNGIGIEATKGIGEGLRQGVEAKLANTFGSTQILGRTAAEQLLAQLGKATKGIETRLESADSPFKGVASVIKSEFQRLIETAFDPQEVLAVSRASQRRARQQRGQVEAEASEELLGEKQQAVRRLQDFREQAVTLKAKNQANIQKLRDQAAAEAPGLEQTIASVGQRAAQPTQRLAEVNATRQQILDRYTQTPTPQRPQAKQQFEALSAEAKQLEAELAALQKEQATAVGRVEQFSAKFDQLQAVNAEIDAVLGQAIEQAQIAFRNQRSVGTPQERRTEAQRQVTETDEQIQSTTTRQQEIVEQRATGVEIGRKVAVKAQAAFEAGDQAQFLDLSGESDLALRIIKQLDDEFQQLAETRKALEIKSERLRATLKSIPEGLPDAVKQAYLDLDGKLPDPDKLPAIRERSTETLGTAQAGYFAQENTIGFRPETLAAINAGQKLTEDQLKELYEEVAHSLQLDAGRLNDESFKRLAPQATPEQIEPVLRELDGYKPDQRPLELDAKIIRDQKVAQALVRQELQELTETIGQDGTELYKLAATKLNAAQANLKAAAATGIDTAPFEAYVARLSDLARSTTAEFARLSIEKFDPERLQALVADVKKTLNYLDDLDAVVATASTRSQPAPQAQAEQGGALTIAREQASDLGGIAQRVGGALAPIAGVAEGTIHALAVVGKAGLALADKFGFAAASLIPGGALAYGPAKAVVKNVVGPLAAAGVASQVPGVGEVLGVLQHAIAALVAPETVGLANGVSAAVTAELHSALPSLFSTLSRGLAESGLPGAGLSSQAVDAVGGLLVHTLEPAVNGVITVADATIHTVGTAAQELLSQLGAALVAGKVVQEGAKLATSEDARGAALKGVETVGSGIGQVVGGVQDGIEGIRDAVDRTSRAVDQNIQEIKQASERVAQGEIAAVGDIVEGVQSVASHVSRGAQDITKASAQAAQDVAQGAGKAASVFGDLKSIKLPDGVNLGDLAQQQLIKIQEQLRQKLERVLDAEAQGLPVIGGSGTVKRDLEIVGQVLEAKYEVVIDHVSDQVQKQIQAAPLDLPVKVELPELEPILVEANPQVESQSKAVVAREQVRHEPQAQDISPIEQAQEQLKAPTPKEPQRVQFNELVAEVDAAIAETDDEVKRVYAHFAEIVEATKKAIKKGDVEAIAKNTSEAKRIAAQLAAQITELQGDIAQSIPLLQENAIDVGPSSAIGERLRKTKSALGQKAALIPQRLTSIGASPEIVGDIDVSATQQINPALAGIADGLNQKAKQLQSALSNLVEAAKTNPKVVSTAKDLAVIGSGMAASAAVSDHGQVASLAAELVAAITTRGALSVGNVGEEGNLIKALQRLTQKLNDPSTQKELGKGLFGDILGFATSHVTDAVTGIPGSGAIAANTIVPKLQQLRNPKPSEDGLELGVVAHKNAEIESVLDDLQQIAAAADKVDATTGDRIALFFLGLKQAFAKAPTPEASQEIKDALSVLEISLADAGSGISKETEQAIAQSDQNLDQIEKQFAKIEAQAREAERLTHRVEEIVGGKELGQQPTVAEFDAQLGISQGANSTSQQEADKKTQQRLLALEAERQRRIAELDGLIATELERIGDDKAEQIVNLKRQRKNLERPTQSYQAEDLGQFATPKATVTPTEGERSQVLRERLERDRSERQINATLKSGSAPKGTPDEIQNLGDSAISSFDKNAAKFEAAAKQIENGSTRSQKALRTVGESVSIFKQKLGEAGGISGVLGKVGQTLSGVAEKAGLPVGILGKLGNTIKSVGVAALAFYGVTQLGDAIATLGQKAFETYSKYELLEKRLKFVGGGDSTLQSDLKFIREESERLKLPVDQLTESFTALRVATKGTAIEGAKTKELANALGTLGRVYGLTAEQSQSVQYQLGQTIRLGRVQGDELRSISDAGINIVQQLEKTTGKSGAEFQKQLEAGQITADQTVTALIALGAEAKVALPDALKSSAVAVDALKKQFVDIALTVGEKTAPLVVAGVGAIGQGVKLLETAGTKLAPVFNAIGQGVGLLLDIASPIVGVIGSVVGAIGGDLLDGIAIPFEAIGAGLTVIRDGFTAVKDIATKALSAIGEQSKKLVDSVPFLGDIIKYANPATIAVRLLGAAIGVYLVAQMTQMSISVGKFVVTSLIAMATTITATVIPAIGAAVTASLAFIATPLGATLVAIGLAAAIAAPHMDELAIAVSGLSNAQVEANNRSVEFNSEYQKGLEQLQKGIPLTAAELQKLKDGFAQSVKDGKDSAHVAGTLSGELDRLQASAEAAAKIQAELAKALTDSTKAIKSQSKELDADYNTRLAGLNDALANQQITKERFDQQELAAQREKSARYVELYAEQSDNLKASLSRAQSTLAGPLPEATRTEVKKQVEQLQEQIYELETKGSEQRIALAKDRVKVDEGIEKDRSKRAENNQKIIENQVAAGIRTQADGEEAITAIREDELRRKIKLLNQQIAQETYANGKLSEIGQNLYSERQVLETELTKVVAEESNKRYENALKELDRSREEVVNVVAEAESAASLQIQDLQNKGLLSQDKVDTAKLELTKLKLKGELALELEHVSDLEALPSPSDPEKEREHQKQIREAKLKTSQLTLQIAEQEYQSQQKARELANKAIEEQAKKTENAAAAIEAIAKLSTNALERQNKLLEAQKGLRASVSALQEEAYKILIDSEKDEEKKAKLQERAAQFRLDGLKQSQALEQKILDLQLEQERVQNRVAIIKAQAAVVKAQAEEQKVLANPEATDAEKQAASLGTSAAKLELGGLVEAAGLQDKLAETRRQQTQVDNNRAQLGARFDLANSRTNPGQKERETAQLQREAQQIIKTPVGVLPIGNKIQADYSQVDSAAQQLGIGTKDPRVGKLSLPTPVDLHSGLGASQGLQIDDLTGEFRKMAELTQAGVVGNLVKIVEQNKQLSTQLLGALNRTPLVQNIQNIDKRRPTSSNFAGLPI